MKKLHSLLLAAALALFTTAAQAGNCSAPDKYVESLSNDVINVIQNGGADAAKEAQLTALFKKTVDSNWMGKFVLGRGWTTLTPDQQKIYLGKYTDYLVASYVPTFRKYSGEKIAVQGTKALEKDGEFTVDTTIDRPGKEAVKVNYRLRKEGGCYKVTDIIAEGISLINTQRQDFGAVFSRKGYDGLIESLDRKIAQPPAPVK